MELGKDKKALKLLKKYSKWGGKRELTSEETDYCIEKGVMYPRLDLMHDEAVDEIKRRAESIDMKEAVNAFLYSLSSGDNRYRTILSSVIYGRSLIRHKVMKEERHRVGETWCSCRICSLIVKSDSDRCDTDLNHYSKFRYYSAQQDICKAGYVLLDLREYRKLEKVNYSEEDIQILNRIFGLAKEIGSGNKIIALQKLITAEKFFKATKSEIYSILGVLSICGVFDTPEHKSVMTRFVPNDKRGFVMEWDLSYPMNYWRGKHGINYDAVEKIFAPVVGDKLNMDKAICGEVKRTNDKSKKSKAEAYFTEGKHLVEFKNAFRYYYGLSEISKEWDKITRYAATYGNYKRSEIFFDGNTIKKMIYEEVIVYKDGSTKPNRYCETDMEVETENRELIIPKTTRGRKQKLTPSLLMTTTYMQGCVEVNFVTKNEEDEEDYWSVSSFNSSNDQYLSFPKGKITGDEDFQEYTKKYLSNLPKDIDEQIDNFRNKKRVTVKFHAGAVIRAQLGPSEYTYALILGRVRDLLKWDEVPKEHPMQDPMAQPVMVRQYDIVTENKNMTVKDLENVPLRQLDVAQDNFVLWETYPVIGYKELTESDIDLGFDINKNMVTMGLGCYKIDEEFYNDIVKQAGEVPGSVYNTSLYMLFEAEVGWYEKSWRKIRKATEEKLQLSHEYSMDEFAQRYGGVTRKRFIELAKEREL